MPSPLQPLSFQAARSLVLREVRARFEPPPAEIVALPEAHGRVLGVDIRADRDYPPFDRSVRDGFAVRAADLPGRFRVIGEARAGGSFAGTVETGETVEIMTGAPVPAGADAVVMVEHCERHADGTVSTDRVLTTGTHIAPRGCDTRAGAVILPCGARIDHTGVAWLATTGNARVTVYAKPRVAILATGDEIVEVEDQPGPHQIRNSNAWSLAAQIARAGALPKVFPVARDEREATRAQIEQALAEADLLLLSGGVSAGKYDVVEPALEDLAAEFLFDRVLIQPGQPLVFGRARNRFFFGLPGNPASTMVTFELFARAAIEILAGRIDTPLDMTLARLTRPFRHRPGLTRFLPAVVSCTEVTPVDWQGSGDVPSMCRANAFLVADAERAEYAEGDLIPVLMK